MTSAAAADEAPAQPDQPRRRRLAPILGVAATVAVLAPVGWLWQQSLVPDTFSVMDMGYPDYGGGPVPGDAADAMGAMGAMDGHGGTRRARGARRRRTRGRGHAARPERARPTSR